MSLPRSRRGSGGVGVGSEDPDRATPELVAAPAEDDRVEPEGEDAREQELTGRAVHQPADELMNVHVVTGSIWAPGHEPALGLLRVFLGRVSELACEVAGGAVAGALLLEGRILLGADRELGDRAAGVKAAAGGRVDRGRDLALEQDRLALGLEVGVGDRDGA